MVINKGYCYRNTIQRTKILEYLKKVRNHPNAETIYNKVVKEIPTITLATVYRNLNILTEQGIIQKIEVNKESRYDAFTHSHIHYICKCCGNIIDSSDKKWEDKIMKNININNFKAEKANITITGKCNKCLEVK